MSGFHDGDADTSSPERLAGIDLNLLVAFDAIVRERNVTRAAQRLGVTQSALSHGLRRLREVVGDPLLVRGAQGMTLTPRAEALVVPLRSALVTLGRALAQPARFDPGTTQRAFTFSSPDLFDVLVVPPLLARVRAEAPRVDLAIVSADERTLAGRLETGELDVAVTPRVDDIDADQAAPGLVRRRLFRDGFSCFMRADHPALRKRKPLTLAAYAALSHAMVSPTGEGKGLVDVALAKQGLARRIALRIPRFYSALAIIAHSDLVLTAPTALARVLPAGVIAFAPPLRLPSHDVHLVWHERFTKDPAHRWLRELIAAVTAT